MSIKIRFVLEIRRTPFKSVYTFDQFSKNVYKFYQEQNSNKFNEKLSFTYLDSENE